VRVDPVTDPFRNVPLHGQPRPRELLAGDEHRVHGNDRVNIAMNEQDRGRRGLVVWQCLDRRQRAGIAHDRGRRGPSLETDAERQHRALAETDERKRARSEVMPFELGIEKGIERGRGLRDAADELAGVAEGEVEPLPAHGRGTARLGRMGRDEGGMGQELRPFAPEADQVVPVGAVAMQEDDELARRAACRRRKTRSVDRQQA
jgi:hypothetical protein